MRDSGPDGDEEAEGSDCECAFPGAHSGVSLYFQADNSDHQQQEGDEADPYNYAVADEVFMVLFEVCEDAFLHAFGPAEVSDDEGGGVVEGEGDCDVGEEGGEPADGQTHDGDYHATGSDHSADNDEDHYGSGDGDSGVELVGLLIEEENLAVLEGLFVVIFSHKGGK